MTRFCMGWKPDSWGFLSVKLALQRAKKWWAILKLRTRPNKLHANEMLLAFRLGPAALRGLQMLAGYLNLRKFPIVVNCYRDPPNMQVYWFRHNYHAGREKRRRLCWWRGRRAGRRWNVERKVLVVQPHLKGRRVPAGRTQGPKCPSTENVHCIQCCSRGTCEYFTFSRYYFITHSKIQKLNL